MILSLLATLSFFFSPKGGAEAAIVKQIDGAKTSVFVQSYSFTSQPIEQALERAQMRHLDVRVILDKNWMTNAPVVESALVACGVKLMVDPIHAIAHNKVMIIDAATVITGSFNFTNQAEHQNAENVVIISGSDGVKAAAIYTKNWLLHASHSVAPVPIPSPAPSTAPRSGRIEHE